MGLNYGRFIGKFRGFSIYKMVDDIVDPLAKGIEHAGHGNYMQTTLSAVDDLGNVVKTWVRKTKTDLFPDVRRKELAAVAPTKASWEITGNGSSSITHFGDRCFWKQIGEEGSVQVNLTPNGRSVQFQVLTKAKPNSVAKVDYHTSWDGEYATHFAQGINEQGKYFSTGVSYHPAAYPVHRSMQTYLKGLNF